ncbi:MAG: hypothetical protein Kow00129_03290 [Thermoleophilia bacterium]
MNRRGIGMTRRQGEVTGRRGNAGKTDEAMGRRRRTVKAHGEAACILLVLFTFGVIWALWTPTAQGAVSPSPNRSDRPAVDRRVDPASTLASGLRGPEELGAQVKPRFSALVIPQEVPSSLLPEIFAKARTRARIIYLLDRPPEALPERVRVSTRLGPADAEEGAPGPAQKERRDETPGPAQEGSRTISFYCDPPESAPLVGALISRGRRPLRSDLDDLTRTLNAWSAPRAFPSFPSMAGLPPGGVVPWKSGAQLVPVGLSDPIRGVGYEHGGSIGYIYVAYPYGMTKICMEGWRLEQDGDPTTDYWLGFAHQESNPGSNLDWPGGWRTAGLDTTYSRVDYFREIHRCRPNTDTGDSDTVSFSAGWPPAITVTYTKPDIEIFNRSSPPAFARWNHRYNIFRQSAQTYHYASPVFEQTVPQGQPFQARFSGTAEWRRTLWGLILWGWESWTLPPFTGSLLPHGDTA